jgi:hypothetical protein
MYGVYSLKYHWYTILLVIILCYDFEYTFGIRFVNYNVPTGCYNFEYTFGTRFVSNYIVLAACDNFEPCFCLKFNLRPVISLNICLVLIFITSKHCVIIAVRESITRPHHCNHSQRHISYLFFPIIIS